MSKHRADRLADVVTRMNDEYQALTGAEPAGFICPVCLTDVPVSSVTRAHAPAQAVGGHVVTYICGGCNSAFGQHFEPGAIDAIRRQRGIRAGEWTEKWRVGSDRPGRSRIKTTVVVRQDPMTGEQELHIHGPKAGTAAHKRWLEEVDLIVRQGADGRMEGKYASNEIVHYAYMSWAYLALVGAAGYAFALSEPGRLVAEAMLAPDLTLMGSFAVVKVDDVPAEPEFEPSYPVAMSTSADPESPDAFGWRFGPVICVFPLRNDPTGEIYKTLGNTAVGNGAWYAADPEGLRRYLLDPAHGPTAP
jgi:hypothetical protein